MAAVAEGDSEDIDRAVEAARRAFNGPWSEFKPFERQNLLLKLADLVDRNFEELAALDTLDMGASISRTTGNRLRAIGMLPYYAARRRRSMARRSRIRYWRLRQLYPEGTGGRRRRDHSLEWPAHRDNLENRAGFGDRLYGGAQAR
jgi:acyl-CoA reductase-like NAD-dependent aldehyde dehydrogenase